MISASVSTIKNSLSSYLEKVKAGQSVMITDHKKPVAILEPVDSSAWPESLRLCFAQGEARSPRKSLNVTKFKQLPAGVGASLAEAILEERRQGR